MDLNTEPLPEDTQPSVDGGDWWRQFSLELRQQNVKSLDTSKRHLTDSCQDAPKQLEQNVTRFEEVIHDAPKSEHDYTLPIVLASNSAGTCTNPQDSDCLDSTPQTPNTDDWHEEVYQKIKTMKDNYFEDLNDMYQKISRKLQKRESLPQQTKIDQIAKLRMFNGILEIFMQVLQISKANIRLCHKEKLQSLEKHIIRVLSTNRHVRPMQEQQTHAQISQAPHEVGESTRHGFAPTSTHQMIKLHRSNVNENINQGLLPQVTCYHNEIVPLRVVEYDGPALGKRFYVCSYWPKTCGFFKWEGEVDEVREWLPNHERPGKITKTDCE